MKYILERLDLSSFDPEQQRFERTPGNGALDTLTGARLSTYVSPGGLEVRDTAFRYESAELWGLLAFELKYPQLSSEDPRKNPGLRIVTSPWQWTFQRDGMDDRAFNTRLVRYIVHMIAFVKLKGPWRKSILWSDFDRMPRKVAPLFDMPMDAELLRISELWQ